MINAKVFISHSAKSELVAEHLEAIRIALEAAGWTVRLDRTGLDVGDGWRSRLFQWMDEVHAAVLLLSQSALESKFVPIELTVLSFRHIREQHFPLLPVLVDDFELKAIQEGMVGELRLTEIQFLPASEPEQTAQHVVRKLGEQFTHSGRLQTPLELLQRDASDLLRNAGFNDLQLVEAAHVTSTIPPLDGVPPTLVHEEFARGLLRADFPKACAALLALADRRTTSDARRCLLELLEMITPFWVPESEAAKLARYSLAACEQRTFLLACMEPWTARNHICRSSLKPLGAGWQVCELPPPECDDELAWIWQQLNRALTPMSGARRLLGTDDIKRRLQRLEANRQPLFLLFPPEWIPSPDLIVRLKRELPTLAVFAIGHGDNLDALRPLCCELQAIHEEYEMEICDTYDETKLRLMPRS
jgi:hypothetical protein